MSKCYPKLCRIWQKQWWEAATGVTRKKENHGKFSVLAVLNSCHRICTSAGQKMNWEGTEVLVWKWSPVATSDKSKKLSYICFCSVTKLCPTLCNPMDYSIPGFLILPFLPEFAQIHVQWVSDAVQSSYPLLPLSPSALNLSQHWCLFQQVSSSHQVAKILVIRLQHQSFERIFRADFLFFFFHLFLLVGG